MSWWGLDSTLKQQAEYANYYRQAQPQACPHDGEPLRHGPPQGPAILYCPWGDFEYPRDWDPDLYSGM